MYHSTTYKDPIKGFPLNFWWGKGLKKSVPIGADVEWWPFFQGGGGGDLRRIAIEAKRTPKDKIYQFLALVF